MENHTDGGTKVDTTSHDGAVTIEARRWHDPSPMFGLSMFARLGIAALFLINGLTAALKPSEFLPLLESNVILGELSEQWREILVSSAIVHDLGIAALVISRRNDAWAAIWMGVWMGSIALTKAMNLVFG